MNTSHRHQVTRRYAENAHEYKEKNSLDLSPHEAIEKILNTSHRHEMTLTNNKNTRNYIKKNTSLGFPLGKKEREGTNMK